MNLDEYVVETVSVRPLRIVLLEPPDIADVPDVIANPIVLRERIVHFLAGHLLTGLDRFLHRAIAMAAAPRIVNLGDPRVLAEVPEHVDEVARMDVVANLFSFIAKYCVRLGFDVTLH